jgi:hypothetical protein
MLMYRTIAIAGATAAVIIGSGAAALAASGSSTPPTPSTPSASSTHAAQDGHGKTELKALRHVVEAQIVTRGKDGAFVTHDLIRGEVTAVSSGAITVRAANGKSEQFTVTPATNVRIRTSGKGTPAKITDVHVGDTVRVAGTGTGTPSATHVVDTGRH